MDLTRICCETVRETDLEATSIINVCLPFGEYVAGRFVCYGPVPEHPVSPLAFFERAIDRGIDFDAVGVQLYFPARDMVAVSRLLDEYARFGKPVHITETWFIAFVLAHSRHKFVYWQDRPCVTRDVVEAHEKAFAFFGGMTHEIVYDQDHLLLTSENYGDLILTHEFALYVQKRGFQVRACRRKDPESKGRVENVVKFVKRNFARHRIFTTVDQLNEDCLAWLKRTGNALMHHTTKKIPAEVFALERQTLRPVHQINIHPRMSITRTVRKDNTIWFEGNRYSVPLGTYNGKDKVVGIELSDSHLRIYDPETGEWLADHERSHLKGQLIQNTHHRRDRTKGIHAYLESVAGKFNDVPLAMNFLEEILKRKSRYIRDQLQLIERVLDEFSPSAAEQALHYCMKYRLYGATDFADAARHFELRVEKPLPPVELVKPLDALNPDVWKAKPQIRQFEIYADILRGG